MYLAIKYFHLLTLVISVLLLSVRFGLTLKASPLLQRKIFKVVPHINDTLLLVSGIGLIFLTGFIPFTEAAPWLGDKLLCVVMYIVLGIFALKSRRNNLFRCLIFFAALSWLAMAWFISATKLSVFM